MSAITQWVQDWSDACTYAAECGFSGMPRVDPIMPSEPWTALATIAIVCYVIWWVNEHRIKANAT